ncbi:DUF2800 domain-containing protein [Listeria ilorinensis]|uniref:DUF2800 domain-containing protein n=1 Tax=Listeria ilorinensis TaxID=2867439 RepID=UPI001EF6855F|nr:DUF2800 domain-containing protein [Listeria ilorinensis]
MPDVHAKLSASGAKRWMSCPGSVQMEEGYADTTSVFAEEGTAAHSLAELMLMFKADKINKRTFTRRLNKFKSENAYYSPSMFDYITEYTDFVIEKLNSYEDAFIDLELRVDFSQWVPEGFGTSDVVIIADGTLEIIDLKYGKGVPVSAEENPQMMLYALGASSEYDFMYEFDKVRMTIVQPRLNDHSTYELPLSELQAWGDECVRPAAELALSGEGPCVPSEPACRFCKAKAVCRARAEVNLAAARLDFEEPPAKLSKEEIAEILLQAPEIKKWIEHVENYALAQARDHGETFPGMKLVEGRSNRVITDKEKAAELLQEAGFEDVFKPRELLTLTRLEKAVGKDSFNDVLADLIIKPAGKPALVSEADKRPEISSTSSAIEDFKNL